jgi:hypothetical protein
MKAICAASPAVLPASADHLATRTLACQASAEAAWTRDHHPARTSATRRSRPPSHRSWRPPDPAWAGRRRAR